MQPEDDPKSAAKKERYRPETDRLMNQFLRMESGGLGRSKEYRRGHEFTFEWPQEWKDAVLKLMEYGMTFEEAFDYQKQVGQRRCPLYSSAWNVRCEKEEGHEGLCVNAGDAFHGTRP